MTLSQIIDHVDFRSKNTQSVEELEDIQIASQKQALPQQSDIFGTTSLRKTRKAANNLPDPLNPPLGFDPNTAFDSLFPFVRVPYLQPHTKEDIISFGAPEEGGYLDPRSKKIPLNSIFFGDNLHVLRAMPSESIDLIYIDPPFFSGKNYNTIWGDDNEVRTFNDIWEDGLPSYLVWLNARLWEMRRTLKEAGSIYVHCDWHASHYIKVELDKIFGYDNFLNEIVWCYSERGISKNFFNRKHDIILLYSKNKGKHVFNYKEVLEEYSEVTKKKFKYTDENGIKFRIRGRNVAEAGKWRRATDIPIEFENEYTYRQYLEEGSGSLPKDWFEMSFLNQAAAERIGYPTQKPELLIEKLIKALSNKNDTVADFFMGGGTTCAVALKLGRKFVGCDISRVAASVTLDRLINIGEDITKQLASIKTNNGPSQLGLLQLEKLPNLHLFYVGSYPVEKFLTIDQQTFNEFILTCYGARTWTGQGYISGVMNAATTILIGPHNPDASLDPQEIQQFVLDSLKQRYDRSIKTKLKIIAWNFPRAVQKYCKQLERYFEKQDISVSLELIPINSQQFRHRISEQYEGRPVNESDFLLKFIVAPSIGSISCKKIGDLKYQFTASGVHSNNLEGILINCQWDFDYKDGRFSEKDYALMREKVNESKRKGMYQAVLTTTKEFEKPGSYLVACKVQDNFGAEAIYTKEFKIE